MIHELNAPRGLGDAIYLRAVALHLIAKGDQVRVYTRWQEVFTGLDVTFGAMSEVERLEGQRFRSPSRNVRSVMACLHCQVPAIQALDKFALSCLQAGIREPVEFSIGWRVLNGSLTEKIRAAAQGRPIVVFQPLRKVRGPFDEEVRPRAAKFAEYVAGADGFKVKVGSSRFTDDDPSLACDLDLYDKTSVTDVLDVVSIADLVVAENCFLPVAAQAMDRKFLLVMSRRALSSPFNKINGITPARMIQKWHLGSAAFDE